MQRDRYQVLIGILSASDFLAFLQIIGRGEKLPLQLVYAAFLIAFALPVQVASFTGDGDWFRKKFFEPKTSMQGFVLLTALIASFCAFALLFWSISFWAFIVFCSVAVIVFLTLKPELVTDTEAATLSDSSTHPSPPSSSV